MQTATAVSQRTIASTEVPQHLRALERANKVRLARAELKRAIARGDTDAAEVVRGCPLEVTSMSVSELLMSQRRWGRTRALKFLTPLRIGENKQLGALTDRQRRLVAGELAKRSARSSGGTSAVEQDRGQPGRSEQRRIARSASESTAPRRGVY